MDALNEKVIFSNGKLNKFGNFLSDIHAMGRRNGALHQSRKQRLR